MAEVKEVFISYHEASAWELVWKLADRLESAGISCWYAGRDIPIGGDFSVTVPKQIADCKVFLLILDKGAVKSEHVHTELYDAFDRYNKKEIAIFPLQIGDFTLTGWAHYFLRTIQVKKYPSPDKVDISALVTEVAHKLGREPVKNGWCGPGTRWTYKDGLLTIYSMSISANMGNFYPQAIPECVNTPWWSERHKITALIIENGVTNIGECAFRDFSNLTSVNMPNSIVSIEGIAFSYCRSLNNIDIPDSVISIETGAFDGCSSLTSVNIPDSVASIGCEAFGGCLNLKSVSVPANAEIASNAFPPTTKVIRRRAR
ncbi:MAG: leucine-rich repeat protein [Oscillospiraceae bacterium]|nr:leucine-rich repeat protein [Oscillospiraceae bacterium]